MTRLIIAPTRSAVKETTRKNLNNKFSKNKNFTAKTENRNLKAPINNVKMQSDKTLTTQIKVFLTIQRMKIFLNETRLQADKENE